MYELPIRRVRAKEFKDAVWVVTHACAGHRLIEDDPATDGRGGPVLDIFSANGRSLSQRFDPEIPSHLRIFECLMQQRLSTAHPSTSFRLGQPSSIIPILVATKRRCYQ